MATKAEREAEAEVQAAGETTLLKINPRLWTVDRHEAGGFTFTREGEPTEVPADRVDELTNFRTVQFGEEIKVLVAG